MNDFRDQLDEGARHRETALRKVEKDLAALRAPSHPLAAIAYWEELREALGSPAIDAITEARDAGHPWAEIAGALDTSTESARNRYKYHQDRRHHGG